MRNVDITFEACI